MATQTASNTEGIRPYFTDQEWVKLPDYMKTRYGNIKANYDMMVALGLQPPVPEFMNPKPAARNVPAKSKAGGLSGQKTKRRPRDPEPEARAPREAPVRRSKRTKATIIKASVNNGNDGCSLEEPIKCPAHGPSFFIKRVPLQDFERARKSLPEGLAVLRSKIKGAQLGIFTVVPLAEGHCFGPYAHSSVKGSDHSEAADQELAEKATSQHNETRPDIARWIRYVNCAPNENECNLVVLQQAGLVYYQTCQRVEPSKELLLWCGMPPTPWQYGLADKTADGLIRRRQRATLRAAVTCDSCGFC
ncbi:histone-lysine N-methyltransferase PRDM7-like isoform X7 [Dermacentor andersoni]|uniref:histone-lysine N-methyltransferase PRDM7-like isoform X7 n=1 Tax=Dermacentor andersoni TaxID=34620 RepID=UPI002415BC8A|nr:histone-lysine N-methyltransferase PRDM9-like isoform X7 [Dermacentor andersoni]